VLVTHQPGQPSTRWRPEVLTLIVKVKPEAPIDRSLPVPTVSRKDVHMKTSLSGGWIIAEAETDREINYHIPDQGCTI
jgi:hypothetical protein